MPARLFQRLKFVRDALARIIRFGGAYATPPDFSAPYGGARPMPRAAVTVHAFSAGQTQVEHTMTAPHKGSSNHLGDPMLLVEARVTPTVRPPSHWLLDPSFGSR